MNTKSLPPASAVADAELAATRSYNQTLSLAPQVAAISAAVFAYFQQQTRVARSAATDERLALASNAAAVMHQLTRLGGPTFSALQALDAIYPGCPTPTTWVLVPGFQMADPRYAEYAAAVEAALAAHQPAVFDALSKAREIIAARAVAHDAEQAAIQAEAMRRAPADLLARLDAAGVVLGVDKGSIVAPAGASLTAIDVEQLARFKPEVVALLKVAALARADAARAVVIA